MKTLIVVIHPNFGTSLVSKSWVRALENHPDLYEIHQLHQVYADGKIDVVAE
jgi:hypothetical protein